MDVVVRKGSSILKLLSSEDESLLIRGNSFLVLDLSFDVIYGVRSFDVESNGLASEGLDEDLHTTSKSENQVESGLLLDVVVRKGSSVLKLLSSENESLLIRGNSFLVLDLSLDVVNGVGGFNIESDGLASEGLDEDLHTTSESQNEVKGGLLLDVVVGKGSSVLKLLSSENESLLIRGNSFLVLDLSLDVVNSVGGFNVESNGLASEGLDEDLHTTSKSENQVESGLLLDVVVRKSSSVFELLSSEDESLLIGGNSFLILNLSLDVVNSVRSFDVEGNGLTSECLNEDLHCKCTFFAFAFLYSLFYEFDCYEINYEICDELPPCLNQNKNRSDKT